MEHDSELTAAIRKQVENLGDLIDDTVPYVFEHVDFHMMIDSLIQREFKRDGFKPLDLSLFPPAMLIDNGVPIPLEQFFNSDYLDTDKKFNCAMAVFYWREINKLIKKNDYVSVMPMLVTAFGLIGFAVERHALDIESKIKAKENGSKGSANRHAASNADKSKAIKHFIEHLADKFTSKDKAAEYLHSHGFEAYEISTIRNWLKGV
ncbi:MAG: hypothetical protein PHC99_10050 [Methylococcales bacterium]|nr:hypothetical protein [Methylococcales bacterium]